MRQRVIILINLLKKIV